MRAPVTGIVTRADKGGWGTIAIRDADGFSHEILHSHAQHVTVGDPIVAGQLIGTMGNTGSKVKNPKDANHVHYQLRDPTGKVIDPSAYWDQRESYDPTIPAHLGGKSFSKR
jgi:murein DD-endopeptidase MepM/ murein hydrolase activator NlpD